MRGLAITFDVGQGEIVFECAERDGKTVRTSLSVFASAQGRQFRQPLQARLRGGEWRDGCNSWPASVNAFIARTKKLLDVAEADVRVGCRSPVDLGPAKAGLWHEFREVRRASIWKWLGEQIRMFASLVESQYDAGLSEQENSRRLLRAVVCYILRGPPEKRRCELLQMRVVLDEIAREITWVWSDPKTHAEVARVEICAGEGGTLHWTERSEQGETVETTSSSPGVVRRCINRLIGKYRTARDLFSAGRIVLHARRRQPVVLKAVLRPDSNPAFLLEELIYNLVRLGSPLAVSDFADAVLVEPDMIADFQRYEEREIRKTEKRIEERKKREEEMARLSKERAARDRERQAARERALAEKAAEAAKKAAAAVQKPNRAALPAVPVHFELPPLEVQRAKAPLADLRAFFLREQAALWWVSNQTDDLLCLPHCRIERLEYQIRTALRVLGPLRGRALLSDEVGLGKTIEAGLIIKELLTRGMVKRFLVLTVPSLVDQWEEELGNRFSLATVTSNHGDIRTDPEKFWSASMGIVASLHTLKQPAHLEIAARVQWDILVVDEAHYLRNRESQAWQAVNALPRQYLLLLTATPVQNSLQELYNLVTLLQPGQLPSPKEFRTRFMDPKRPRQPREPEELRRLLGQVMIRNTRANAGVKLPPRRAETVLFEPLPAESVFWDRWESELRSHLVQLNSSQASLWGRLLLQAAGSSPAAWQSALKKFPQANLARAWREQAPLEGSWARKCALLAPLTRAEGGVVIFTQFLDTQAAVADYLRGAGVPTFVVHGGTPAAERQPITEEFRRKGGALLLTHSGTEGRNLQFCHHLMNFDLPWNPMEIEQRIGRLHRLGQQHVVRIFNFVQAGTVQEHLLQILQEKLNLFELVVGETGLVLGERFSSDEFAEEVFRRWQESDGRVSEAFHELGEDLVAARRAYDEIKSLDATLFTKDYESV